VQEPRVPDNAKKKLDENPCFGRSRPAVTNKSLGPGSRLHQRHLVVHSSARRTLSMGPFLGFWGQGSTEGRSSRSLKSLSSRLLRPLSSLSSTVSSIVDNYKWSPPSSRPCSMPCLPRKLKLCLSAPRLWFPQKNVTVWSRCFGCASICHGCSSQLIMAFNMARYDRLLYG